MVKRIYESWREETPDGIEITFTTKENAKISKEQGLISNNAFLEYSIEADTSEEASAIHNLRQGLGAHKPMGEAQPCP